MEKTINIGGRLHNPAVGGSVAGADEIKDDTKGKKQNVINQETDAELVRLDEAKQEKLTFDQIPTEESANPVTSGGVYAADAALQQAIEAILLLIPSAASALNQLADKSFVNSSVSTATATFRGTYNLVTDLGLTVSATHQQIATALVSVVSTADNNDYCFVQIPVSDQSSDIRVTERYKFDGTAWSYEYDLNNSGFTADQWAAINSGITSALVGKLGALPTVEELAVLFNGKQNVLTFDNVPTAGSNNPVKSGGLYEVFAVINAMIPTGADANNKLVAENRLVAYVTSVIEALDASYNITTGDGHVTLRLTQVNGAITSLQIATDDIASATALTALGERVSMNERDIDNLQAAYEALTQSDIVVVNGALPSSGQQQNIIYRQPDQDHTPPQFYSDYMWNGTTWVLMATYNNAIDPRPKKGSQNLVTSGGVFDNMGALDLSELNATENPHTLATYADLSAAIAAIPSDYQKGGMSIKYVQTSDNKYVKFFCTADEFTTDVTKWQGEDDEPTAGSNNLVKSGGVVNYYGEYIENPEFVRVFTDKKNRILWAIKKDGTVYYGAGVPPQMVDYIQSHLNLKANKINAELIGKISLDKEIDSNNKTIETSIQNIENPEFVGVWLDKNGKILFGVQKGGNFFFGAGIPNQIIEALNSKVDKESGKGLSTNDFNNENKDIVESFRFIENPEFVFAALDALDRVVFGVHRKGGNFFFGAGIPNQIKEYIDSQNSIIKSNVLFSGSSKILFKPCGVNVHFGSNLLDVDRYAETIAKGLKSCNINIIRTHLTDDGVYDENALFSKDSNSLLACVVDIRKDSSTGLYPPFEDALAYVREKLNIYLNKYDGNTVIEMLNGETTTLKITMWETLNELELRGYTIEECFLLYKEVYTIIKNFNPDYKVVFGSISSLNSTQLRYIKDLCEYTEDVDGLRFWDLFDVFNFHIYDALDDFENKCKLLYEIMLKYYNTDFQYNFIDKPVWLTEYNKRNILDDSDEAYSIPKYYLIALSLGVEKCFLYQFLDGTDRLTEPSYVTNQKEAFYGICHRNYPGGSYMSFLRNDNGNVSIGNGSDFEKVYFSNYNQSPYLFLSCVESTDGMYGVLDRLHDFGLKISGDKYTLVNVTVIHNYGLDNQTEDTLWSGEQVITPTNPLVLQNSVFSSVTNKDVLRFEATNIDNSYSTLELIKKESFYSFRFINKLLTTGSSRPFISNYGNIKVCTWTAPNGNVVYALWNTGEDKTIKLDLGNYFTAYNYLGENIEISPKNIDITKEIIYLVNCQTFKIYDYE